MIAKRKRGDHPEPTIRVSFPPPNNARTSDKNSFPRSSVGMPSRALRGHELLAALPFLNQRRPICWLSTRPQFLLASCTDPHSTDQNWRNSTPDPPLLAHFTSSDRLSGRSAHVPLLNQILRDRVQHRHVPTPGQAPHRHLVKTSVAAQRVDPFRRLGTRSLENSSPRSPWRTLRPSATRRRQAAVFFVSCRVVSCSTLEPGRQPPSLNFLFRASGSRRRPCLGRFLLPGLRRVFPSSEMGLCPLFAVSPRPCCRACSRSSSSRPPLRNELLPASARTLNTILSDPVHRDQTLGHESGDDLCEQLVPLRGPLRAEVGERVIIQRNAAAKAIDRPSGSDKAVGPRVRCRCL